jgi:lambda family phage portal protein
MTAVRKGIQSEFDAIRADYDMTRHSRFVRRRTGVAAMGSGPDYHFRSESKYYEAIEQARDMDRNDALVGILADRRVDNIVQSGFTLDPKTGDKGLDLALWQWWEDFSNDPDQCDISGEYTWKEIERQCCRSESIDGDIVVTGTEEGSFQLLESHLIRTKSKVADTFLGVTTNRVGRRMQYHVAEELNEFGTFGDSVPVDVRNADGVRQVFHVYNPNRVNPTRGVTLLAPIFSISGMLEDINFAKLVQQQVVSCFAIFRKLAATQSGLPSADGVYGEGGVERTESGVRQIEGVSPGMEIVGQPGEELQGFSPNVPNSEYFQQVRLMLQIIGVNFGLPLCLVLMDGSETNFSGWRGAVDEARKGFVADQLNLVRRLNRPAYKWKLSKYLAETKDKALRKAYSDIGERIFTHNWNLPTWSYIEPVADAEGDAVQLRNALTSPRRLHAARGKDWEEIAEESIADNAYAIERAAKQAEEINAQFPGSPMVNWRDLIALPMPEGMTMAMQDPALDKENGGVISGGRDVAAEALNGAQVSSLVEVINQVAAGVLPKDTAKAILKSAFPSFGSDMIDEIIDPVQPGSVVLDSEVLPASEGSQSQGSEGSQSQGSDEAPTGEFAGISTQQWNRNRKAIQKILEELSSGETSEAAARVFLGGVGLTQSSIDALIADALDGQVETPEVLEDVA